MKLKEDVQKGLWTNFEVRDDEVLVMGSKLCVSDIKELKEKIMVKAHYLAYVMHHVIQRCTVP